MIPIGNFKETIVILHKLIGKMGTDETLPNLFYETSVTLITKW